LQADFFWPLAGGEDASLEVQTAMGQGAECVGRFEVDEVLGSLGGD